MGEIDREAIFAEAPDQESKPSDPGDGKASDPQYVTTEEAQKMADDAAENAFTKAQSLIDTNVSRVEKSVQDQVGSLDASAALLKAAGHELPEGALEAAKNQALVGSFLPPPEPASNGDPSGEQDGQPDISGEEPDAGDKEKDPVTVIAQSRMEKAGVTIGKDDPEFPLIDLKTDDANVFLDTVDQAIAAKSKRLLISAGIEEEEGDSALTAEQRRARMASLNAIGTQPGRSLPDFSTGEDYLDLAYGESTKEPPSKW